MSLVRLLLSGLLVASGLILATFTLHGYLDPQWAQRQAQSAGVAERPGETRHVNAFQGRSRFVSSRADPAGSAGKLQPVADTPVKAKSNATVAAAKTAPKPSATRKKAAERPRKAPPPQQQQASFQWPWSFFSN